FLVTKKWRIEIMAEEVDEDNGISFVTAIERRYVETCLIDKEVLTLPQMYGNDRTIELIGLEKRLNALIEADVSRMNITCCGSDCHSLIQALRHTKTLILSNNLLTDWPEVAKIVANIECLTDLVLIPKSEELDLHSFKAIKTLVIDNMDYDWNDILWCAQMWPNIERLDVWGNRVTELKSPHYRGMASRLWPNIERLDVWGNRVTELKSPHVFTQLIHLSLCNNSIEEWHHVCRLATLPNLKTLNVSDCKLNSIHFDDSDAKQKTKLFPRLEFLSIGNNNLKTWRDVSELNKLQKLDQLFIKNNPISEMMRRDAEIAYLRKTNKIYETAKSLGDEKLHEFINENPTFESILLKFGKPFGSESISKAEIEKKKFLTIKLRNPFDNEKCVEKKIPASISIINLKTIVRKLFEIDYNYDINLLWTSKDFECPLDKESQNLNFYSIENGDTILVNIQ
ncbi:unnamed protein product, partial [Medioppia subpectinata]